MKGYTIDSGRLASDLGASIRKEASYYLIKISLGFKTEDFSKRGQCDFDLAVKRAELKFTLMPFLLAEECYPQVEQAAIKEQREHEVVALLSPEGQIEFLGFKTAAKLGGRQWRTLTKTTVTTLNTYCYCYGKLTSRPGWIFQTRKGQNFLESQREVVLVVEAPRGEGLSGYVEFFPRDIVLLDPEHRVLRWPRQLWAKILKLINRDRNYSPAIAFGFGHVRVSPFRFAARYPFPVHLAGLPWPLPSLTAETLAAIKQEVEVWRKRGAI